MTSSEMLDQILLQHAISRDGCPPGTAGADCPKLVEAMDRLRENPDEDAVVHHFEMLQNRAPWPAQTRERYIRGRLEMWEALGLIAPAWLVQSDPDRKDWVIAFRQEFFGDAPCEIGDAAFRMLDLGRSWGVFEVEHHRDKADGESN